MRFWDEQPISIPQHPFSSRRCAIPADGGFDAGLIEVLAETYGRGLPMDGRKTQSFQSTAGTAWPRFSLAVQLSAIPKTVRGPLDGGKEIDSIAFSRKLPALMSGSPSHKSVI